MPDGVNYQNLFGRGLKPDSDWLGDVYLSKLKKLKAKSFFDK
jgi:hypothetical protein